MSPAHCVWLIFRGQRFCGYEPTPALTVETNDSGITGLTQEGPGAATRSPFSLPKGLFLAAGPVPCGSEFMKFPESAFR